MNFYSCPALPYQKMPAVYTAGIFLLNDTRSIIFLFNFKKDTQQPCQKTRTFHHNDLHDPSPVLP